MIRLPSLIKPYDAYFSGDEALEQPPVKPSPDASDDERKAYKTAVETYESKLAAAWDTGEWSPLLLPGKQATKFVLAQVDREIWRWMLDRGSLSESSEQRLGDQAMLSLLFRLALVDVVGIDGLKIRREPDPHWNGWVMAQREVVTLLDLANPGIVTEIGSGIYRRLIAGLLPKS